MDTWEEAGRREQYTILRVVLTSSIQIWREYFLTDPTHFLMLYWNIFGFLLTYLQQQKRLGPQRIDLPRPRLSANPAVKTGFWFRLYSLDHQRTVLNFCTSRADLHGMRPVNSFLKWSVWAGERVKWRKVWGKKVNEVNIREWQPREMISQFWNLCRACPAMDVDKVQFFKAVISGQIVKDWY